MGTIISTDSKNLRKPDNLEIWGGIECTINRVGDTFLDQLQCSGHYERESDIHEFARLGIKALRYPILWERHQPAENSPRAMAGFHVAMAGGGGLKPTCDAGTEAVCVS